MSRRLSTAMVVLGLPIVGAAIGGYVGGQLSSGDMGFDQIGAVMGGLATGVLAGLIVAIALVRRLGDRMLHRIAVLTAAAVVTVSAVLYMRYRTVSDAASRPATPAPARP